MEESPQSLTELRVSEKFNAVDAEVVFKSSDDVIFRIHWLNLTACTEGFSPPETSTFSEIVPLTEPSATLELLFVFLYPQPLPDLGELDFDLLSALAEAAEKYRVFSAMNLCTIHLTEHLQDHPEEILVHGLKHGIEKFIVHAAPSLLDQPLEEFLPRLPICYVRYHGYWAEAQKFAIASAPAPESMSRTRCESCDKLPHDYVLNVIANMNASLRALQDLQTIFPHKPCSFCHEITTSTLKSWRMKLGEKIDLIPNFYQISVANAESLNDASQFDLAKSTNSAFNESDEVQFKSTDGTIFQLSKKTLRACTTALLPDQSQELPVLLSDSSETIEILFKFLCNAPHPDLAGADIRILGPLSLAASNYGIPLVTCICNFRMA
ncbi:hypothetical protein H0H87_008656 [Tephrocybe sp. NHM501043]|nr:hypothetical protein H0H87_008656 [Tephrocybe sp. NHM501043]